MAAAPATSCSSMIEFSDKGDVLNVGKRTVEQAGFVEGSLVQLNPKAIEKSKGTVWDQWKIVKVNQDGSVLLNIVNKDGTLDESAVVSVDMDAFLSSYKAATSQIEIEKRQPLAESDDFHADLLHGIVYEVLYRTKVDFPEGDLVRVQTKPSKAIFSLRSWAPGESIAIPVTGARQLKVVQADKDDGSNPFVAVVSRGDGAKVHLALNQLFSKTHVSLPYLLKTTDKKEDANLEVSSLSVGFIVWALKGERVTVEIPVIKAVKHINVEDEMALFVVAKEKKETKKARVITLEDECQPPAKKEKKGDKKGDKKDKKSKKA